MHLESIPKRKNRVMSAKRIGRGYGSGVGGHTSTRGMKGQKSRSGHKSLVFFEGGNTPFFRRIPKLKGFRNTKKIVNTAMNLDVIEKNFKAGETVSLESLLNKGLIAKNTTAVKILGEGELTKKISVEGIPASKTAITKIEKAGGTIN